MLPAVTLGWYSNTLILRITRSSMLDVLDSEYIKLARLEGLPERVVIWKHALKNAAVSILTTVGFMFIAVISGAVVTETVFAWPGVGRLLVESVLHHDFPVIQTIIILIAIPEIVKLFLGGESRKNPPPLWYVRRTDEWLWPEGGRIVLDAGQIATILATVGVVVLLVVWGIVALGLAQPIVLLKIGANVAGAVFVIAAPHLLYVNTRLLPAHVRPPMWRRLALIGMTVFYGFFVALSASSIW